MKHRTRPARTWRRSAYAAAAVATMTLAALSVTTLASAATTPTASFSQTSTWDTGYNGQYVITAGTVAVPTWQLEFDLPAGSTVTTSWNGEQTTSGQHYTFRNASWNGNLAAGQSASLGFGVQGLGKPVNCLINGVACGATSSPSASTGPTSTPNSSPSPSRSASASPSPSRSASPSPTPTSAGGTGTYRFAPYVDTDQRQDLVAVAASGNTKYLTLAFVLANGNTCSAVWNGGVRDATWLAAIKNGIDGLRAAGGDVIVSFGGASGTELAQACTTVASLKSAYQSMIDTYGLTHLDFDIEGGAVADQASVDRRSQALAQLQQANPGLVVSLTLPVLPTGLDANGLNVVKSAKANGLALNAVNIMAMDYGQWAAPNGNQMGAYAQQAAQATRDQLATVYTGYTDAQLWGMVGVTPMIGVNDICWDAYCEIFTTTDAAGLVTFAKAHHLNRLAMWSMNRDVVCRDGSGNPVAHTYADPSCSSVIQTDYAFSHALAAYTG